MDMTTYSDISSYFGIDAETGNPSKNYMGWTNTLQRANPFPVEMYSVFPSLDEAEAYAAGSGKYAGLPYEGQIIAVTNQSMQKVYVLDSSMPNGLRQLAAGDDASEILELLNAEISNRISADKYLSGAISSETSTRQSETQYLSSELSGEIQSRISADELLSSSLSVSIDTSTTKEGYLKSYTVKQGTREVGVIDIPKDYLVKSASVKVVTEADTPYEGAEVGDKYIDFEVNVKAGSEDASHLYIPIKEFFTAYKAGVTDTISVDIGDDNTISAVVRASSITSAELADNAVTTAKIVDGAVLSAKISDGQVVTSKLADGAVTTDKIDSLAVTSAKIAGDAVTTDKLADNAVTNAKIADDAVDSAQIKDGAVTTDKINGAAVTADKLATDSVTNEKIADNAVGTSELSAQAVTTAKIADNAVTTDKINGSAVTTTKIADNAVTNAKVADSAISESKLSASSVTTAKIADSAVTTDKINSSAVTTDKINSSAVTTDKIADNAVTNDKLGLSSVTLDKMSGDVIDYIDTAAGDSKEYTDQKISQISGDVIDYIDTAAGDSKEYTDQKISQISGDWIGDASKTVTSVSQRDGKLTVSAADIAIKAAQVTDLTSVVGNYVPLSVASSNASSADKLQTASEVSAVAEDYAQAYAQSAVNALDVGSIGVGASMTLVSIGEVDGKISAEATDILISESQVTGLTADLASINSGISYLSTSIDGLDDSKLDKSTFSAISNEIGLSAASSSNPVVTKDDIADLAGAMHFIGTVTLSSDDDTVAAAVARQYPDHVVAAGDVVVVTSTSKEYVYAGGQWVELGDETLYATKAEVSTLSSQLTANDQHLSTAIDSKIYIDGISAETLSAIHISQDDFYQKVIDGTILSNELYIVSGDYINAYGQQIKNLADPSLSDDAATKAYVDSAVEGVSTNALTGVVLNGASFTVDANVASLSVEVIDCGSASS